MNKQKTLLRLIMLCIVVMISVACLGLGLVACDNSGQHSKPGPTPSDTTTVTATLNADGGTCASNSAQLTNGQSFSLPVPTKTGYTFDGWSANGNKITDKNGNGLNVWNITVNVTIIAIWTANDYTVTFDPSEGELDDATKDIKYGESFQLPVPTRPGYTFGGWSANGNKITDEEGNGLNVWNITVNVTIVAIWTANNYTVTFDPSQGELDDTTKDIKYGESFQLPVPTRPGYTFGGWSANGNKITDENGNGLNVWNITVNVTIVAIWNCEHKYGEWEITKSATCTTDGSKTKTCEKCGHTETKIIDALQHNYINNVCQNCGEDFDGNIEGLAFEYIADTDSYTVKKYTGSAKFITIPSTYNEKPVTSIGNNAFSGCTGLTSITIPDSVTSIGDWAFSGCTGLTSITISNNVTYIGTRTFYSCRGLTNISIPDSVTGIGGYAFQDCYNLTSITIPNSVTYIGNGVLISCNALKYVSIPFIGSKPNDNEYTWFAYLFGANSHLYAYEDVPKSLTTVRITGERITTDAFSRCSGLTTIYLGANVISIPYGAFKFCSGLTTIIVDKNNPKYHISGNCLIETASKTLILGLKNSTIPTDGSVTSIGNSAFMGCSELINISIPDSVTSIGGYAFSYCYNLTNIIIPDSVTYIDSNAFYNCSNLTSITIPDSVTSIGSDAFMGCSELINITMPDSVTSIGSGALDDTAWYKNQPNGLVYAGKVAYKYKGTMPSDTSITIKEGTKGIADYAFSRCGGLTSIIIPDSVTSIGSGALDDTAWYNNQPDGLVYAGKVAYKYKGYMPSNTSISIEEGTKGITDSAFSRCDGLTSITIPDSVTIIGDSAFSGCTGLTSITIPDSVTNIGNYAFQNCTRLTSIIIPDSVISIGEMAFYGCTGLTSITIPDSVTNIGNHAFQSCIRLTNITIPDSVTSIGDWVFDHCSGLTSITISNSVTSIGDYAFSYCKNLTSITIPDSVTYIGNGAFRECSNITNIYFNSTKAEWDAIGKGDNWNSNTGDYTLHCSDGDYDKDGNKIESR